jgi:hypothetical protein
VAEVFKTVQTAEVAEGRYKEDSDEQKNRVMHVPNATMERSMVLLGWNYGMYIPNPGCLCGATTLLTFFCPAPQGYNGRPKMNTASTTGATSTTVAPMT